MLDEGSGHGSEFSMNQISPKVAAELAYLGSLLDLGYTDVRPLPGERWAGLFQFMFTSAIIVGRMGDRHGYSDRWCYRDKDAALAALDAWTLTGGAGEPEGWHRHPDTGRRVAEDGTAYVNF